jgi:hypothetical protein
MTKDIIPIQQVAKAIRFVREERVLLDFDLARPYGVSTGNLNKAVRQNRDRFPADFMFQLSARGDKIFDIPTWNIKRPRRTAPFPLRFHRARCSDALKRFKQ